MHSVRKWVSDHAFFGRLLWGCILSLRLGAQDNPTSPEAIQRLLDRLATDEVRIKEDESKLRDLQQRLSQLAALAPSAPVANAAAPAANIAAPAAAVPPPEQAAAPQESHDHEIRMGAGGPVLNIRGFTDLNLGFGQAANPLQFPLGTPVKSTFQIGEVDLFLTSNLSDHFRFVSEMVFGADPTNVFSIDIERLQLTYRANPYFQLTGGRFHTAIGYYNTAYHHGTWFQTATGRPFMYYFEDSGGMLPVHSVGATAEGEVRGAEKIGLHWIAEVSNGRSSSALGEPVQNFLSDKNHKAFNFAGYIRPQAVRGLQIGGSYYRDLMLPLAVPPVTQQIGSAYAILITPAFEFMNEAVMISNSVEGLGKTYHSPLMYTQIGHRIGRYRPYFRYQYVNVPWDDPVNILAADNACGCAAFAGRYQGPSPGVRLDLAEYVALKFQYNRIYQRAAAALNGFDTQLAFTF